MTRRYGSAREVTLDVRRRIRLPAEFAAAMRLRRGAKLRETLIHLPGLGAVVLLTPRRARGESGTRLK